MQRSPGITRGAHGGGTVGKSTVRFPMVSLEFFIEPILGSTQPLIEMSTRHIYWEVKAAGAYGLQPYSLHLPIVLKSRNFILL